MSTDEEQDIEVTLEKVLDGYPLLYHLAAGGCGSGRQPSNDFPSSEVAFRGDVPDALKVLGLGRERWQVILVTGDVEQDADCWYDDEGYMHLETADWHRRF